HRVCLEMIKRLGKRHMPILLHPDAFLNRKVILPDKHELHTPAPNRNLLEHENIEFVVERGCSYLLEGMVLVTGQIHRTTVLRKAFPAIIRRAIIRRATVYGGPIR